MFLIVSQQRRFAAQNDKEIEGLGTEFVRNSLGICSEFARSSLGIRSGFARKTARTSHARNSPTETETLRGSPTQGDAVLLCSPDPRPLHLTTSVFMDVDFNGSTPIRESFRGSRTTTKYSKWHFPAEKSVDFPTLRVADICRKPCDLRSKTQIPPTRKWKK